jgi:protein TonB
MSLLGQYLTPVWTVVLTHLWQSSLIIVPLFLLAIGLRRAPARWQEALWGLALLKLFLPLALFGALVGKAGGWLADRLAPTTVAVTEPVVAAVGVVLEPTPSSELGQALAGPGFILVLAVMSALWLASFLWGMVHLAQDLERVRRLRARSLSLLPAPLRARSQRILAEAGIPFDRVRFTEESSMPAVVGFRRPHIIVPLRLIEALPDAELVAILKHEDGHRRRRDPLRCLLLRFCRSVFFFYPLVYPVLRRLGESAEYACDEEALATGIGAGRYAQALARSVNLALAPAPLVAAAGSGGNSLFTKRLLRLHDPERRIMSRYRLILVVAGLLVCVGSFLPLSLSADPPPAPPATPAAEAEPAEPPAPAPAAPPETEAKPEPVPAPPEPSADEPAPEATPAPAPSPSPPQRVKVADDPPPPPPKDEEAAKKPAKEEEAAKKAAASEAAEKKAAEEEAKKVAQDKTQKTAQKEAQKKECTEHKKEKAAAGEAEGVVTRAELIHFEEPVYPEKARQAKVGGTVYVKALVGPDGKVLEAVVKKGIEDYPELDKAALKAAYGCKFKPATQNGIPVKAWVKIPFKFKINGEPKSTS